MSKPRKLETQRGASGFVLVISKLINLEIHLYYYTKIGSISSGTFSKRRKERILKEQFLLISTEWLEWKLLKTCIAIFGTCLQSLCSKN